MTVQVDIQNACDSTECDQSLPDDPQVSCWVRQVVQDVNRPQSTVTIRFVGEQDMIRLNGRFRGRYQATNVLSFPYTGPEEPAEGLLGDVIVCLPVVDRQARDQEKSFTAHLCHMVVHGVLHLLGYDHEDDAEAAEMEHREIEILRHFGFPDPYSGVGPTAVAERG